MSHSNQLLRWTFIGRWIATLGLGLMVALGYFAFRPASAQDRAAANRAGGEGGVLPSPAGRGAGGEGSAKNSADIAKMATNDVGSGEAEKKDKDSEAVNEGDWLSWLRDIHWRSPHMWAFYAICIVSFVAVGFAVERFLGIRQSKVLPADLAAGLRAVASRKGEFDLRHAQRLCRQYPSSAAHVVKAMLAKVGRPVPEIEKAMTESLEHEATRMFANVRVQNLAFNVAPMLGLAGTVHGMILCFYKTAHMPVWANKMDQLADGIYAALICTLAGLVVAIPAGILAHYFEGRIISLFQRVEELARLIVLPLERFEGRSRAVLTGEKQPSSTSVLSMPRNDDPDDDDDDPLPSAKSKTLEGRP